jgi:hypothetical protein
VGHAPSSPALAWLGCLLGTAPSCLPCCGLCLEWPQPMLALKPCCEHCLHRCARGAGVRRGVRRRGGAGERTPGCCGPTLKAVLEGCGHALPGSGQSQPLRTRATVCDAMARAFAFCAGLGTGISFVYVELIYMLCFVRHAVCPTWPSTQPAVQQGQHQHYSTASLKAITKAGQLPAHAARYADL